MQAETRRAAAGRGHGAAAGAAARRGADRLCSIATAAALSGPHRVPSLHARRLSVALGGRTIVEIEPHRVGRPGWVGVIGANGSGKTDLAARAGRPPAGRRRRDRDRWRALRPRSGAPGDADRLRTGDRRAAARAHRPRHPLAGGAARSAQIAAPDLAPLRAALGVGLLLATAVGTWSAGMRQRLAIYAAFVGGQPPVIL